MSPNQKTSPQKTAEIAPAEPGPAPEDCLAPTWFLNYESPEVQAYIAKHSDPAASALENALRLYPVVRDGIRYNPYTLDLSRESFRLSLIVTQRQSYCIPKAMLYAGVCRALGIPARLGFGDVKNHLATGRLIEYLRTDLFAYHGYAELYLDGRWVQATPAFDARLCKKFGVAPLEFDGSSDSLFQEFDGGGRRFMEYVRYHGTSPDLPYEWLMNGLSQAYPHIYHGDLRKGDMLEDLELEKQNAG